MKLDELPPRLRELYEAVDHIGTACESFHVSCDIAEAMLPDDSPLLEPCKAAKKALDEFSIALPKLARAIAVEADRLNKERAERLLKDPT